MTAHGQKNTLQPMNTKKETSRRSAEAKGRDELRAIPAEELKDAHTTAEGGRQPKKGARAAHCGNARALKNQPGGRP